ncbi:MAG: electron transfer flavoprotein subunit beta/FixA family protein [Thermomicrobiaceae bacterium]
MKIVVLVKEVPDPNALRLDPRTGQLQPGTPTVANEYDLYGMEAAAALREAGNDVEIVVATLGSGRDPVNRCLAMGADRAVVIDDPALFGGDAQATATVLANYLKDEGFDLLFVGQEASDSATGDIGPRLAAMLDLPVVSNLIGLELSGDTLTLKREIEDGHQTLEVSPPVILCALSGLPDPRYPSLKGIMASRKKQTDVKTGAELGLEGGETAPLVSWGNLFIEEQEAQGIIVEEEDTDQAVDQLVTFLEEKRLI